MKKILYILDTPEPNGCSLVRNIIPAEGLQTLGWEPHFLPIDPKKSFDFDIVCFSRMYQLSGIKPVFKMIREKCNAKIVYDTDDLIDHIASDNPFQAEYGKKDLIGAYHYFLDTADLVTVTTDYLKQEIAKRRKGPISVIPNAIRQFNIREGGEKKVRILYTGSDTHFPDLNLLLDVILDLQKKYDFEFITQGIGIKDIFENNYGHLPNVMRSYNECKEKLAKVKNYIYYPNVKAFEYHDNLTKMNITIGVCPLHDDKFTRCKSAIKYYDYVASGAVVLAQNCIVYQDCNYTAKRFADWRIKLERLITDKPFREEILEWQTNYVTSKRSIDLVKYIWDEEFRKILK